jgi:hypothetical protein
MQRLFVYSLYNLTSGRTQAVILLYSLYTLTQALTQAVINCVQHVHSNPFPDSGSD